MSLFDYVKKVMKKRKKDQEMFILQSTLTINPTAKPQQFSSADIKQPDGEHLDTSSIRSNFTMSWKYQHVPESPGYIIFMSEKLFIYVT